MNALALGGGVWLLRGPRTFDPWALSLWLSTLASLSGSLLLVDMGLRAVASWLIGSEPVLQPSELTLWLCGIWMIFAGPVLLITALAHRVKGTPVSVYLLQFAQVLAWLYNCLWSIVLAMG
jgi:hypothetical protein